jgi:hypothetical protein
MQIAITSSFFSEKLTEACFREAAQTSLDVALATLVGSVEMEMCQSINFDRSLLNSKDKRVKNRAA